MGLIMLPRPLQSGHLPESAHEEQVSDAIADSLSEKVLSASPATSS
jgi:hypothetical protein